MIWCGFRGCTKWYEVARGNGGGSGMEGRQSVNQQINAHEWERRREAHMYHKLNTGPIALNQWEVRGTESINEFLPN